jgi:DNA modification methylase/endonuclease YncB( thermonuclease family)
MCENAPRGLVRAAHLPILFQGTFYLARDDILLRMPTFHRVIIGDSRRMAELEDGSVELVVTSPPYWQLKDYGRTDQIGFHDSYEDYINNLNLVWSECIRVLHPGCRLCINIGDQFARSVYYGRYKVIPIRTEIIKFCETAGLDYMGAVIWRKVTTCNTTGGATIMGSFPYPRNGILKIDYEFILIFKKPGEAPSVPTDVKERARFTSKEWNEHFSGHWTFPGEKQGGRLASFPEELPRRLIRMFTFEGETVLDPFLGSGTTSLAAMRLGRDSVGFEINRDFLPAIQERLVPASSKFKAVIETEYQDPAGTDFGKLFEKLPYIFRDPLKLDRKADPRESGFGSIIDGSRTERRELLSVLSVPSPEMLELSDGRRVRLLGARPVEGKEKEAIDFLRGATCGRKVFLRSDPAIPETKGVLAAYVYLRDRTFLNAHLIKRGLAEADDSVRHRYSDRFRAYEKVADK